MNTKKLAVSLSVLVLGLASCGNQGTSLTRKEAEAKLDEIVAATPATQHQLTAKNGTMNPSAATSTYVFNGATNYSHIVFASAKELKANDMTYSVSELYAYLDEANYVFGYKGKVGDDANEISYSVTLPSTNALVAASMAGLAQNQIDAFVECGRKHWHNGAAGLSAYLKRQDIIEAEDYENRSDIVVNGETITTGATEKGSYIKLADEKYSTKGEGNLTLDFDALYPNPDHPEKLHEPLLFEFNDNLLTHWYNKKAGSYKGNEWVMTYGTAETAKTSFQAADVSTAEAVARAASIVSLITGFVQADQPHGSADLYPSHWN